MASTAPIEEIYRNITEGHEAYKQYNCTKVVIYYYICCRSHLLTEILTSHDLYVMQIEMDVYTLAKKV